MNDKQLKDMLHMLTMPEDMADSLRDEVLLKKRRCSYFPHYSKIAAAAAALIFALVVGSTSYAVYQVKNLRVFFEADATDAQIERAGEMLAGIEGVSKVEYVSSDRAWEEFKAEYFSGENGAELAEEFTENPLKDSYNYKVSVELSANTREVRKAIENIDGVRMVSDLTELDSYR